MSKPKYLHTTAETLAAVKRAREMGWIPDPSAGGKAKPPPTWHAPMYAEFETLMAEGKKPKATIVHQLASKFEKSESQINKVIAKLKKLS